MLQPHLSFPLPPVLMQLRCRVRLFSIAMKPPDFSRRSFEIGIPIYTEITLLQTMGRSLGTSL